MILIARYLGEIVLCRRRSGRKSLTIYRDCMVYNFLPLTSPYAAFCWRKSLRMWVMIIIEGVCVVDDYLVYEKGGSFSQ